jgi:hypothetical protein
MCEDYEKIQFGIIKPIVWILGSYFSKVEKARFESHVCTGRKVNWSLLLNAITVMVFQWQIKVYAAIWWHFCISITKNFFKRVDDGDLVFGKAWCTTFYQRNKLSLRAATTKMRDEIPADFEARKSSLHYICLKLFMITTCQTTWLVVAMKRTVRIRVIIVCKEKSQITVMHFHNAKGKMVEPTQLIYLICTIRTSILLYWHCLIFLYHSDLHSCRLNWLVSSMWCLYEQTLQDWSSFSFRWYYC